MTTLSILNHAKKLNAAVITALQVQVTMLRDEARTWKAQGETAFHIAACDDLRKERKKLTKAIQMQERVRVEIEAIARNESIVRKFEAAFGRKPEPVLTLAVEQEAMLDRLLAEREVAVAE